MHLFSGIGITLRHSDVLVGMGRIIGDGGTVVQITDVAVHPDYQGKGYGKIILNEIQAYIRAHIPKDAFVCLFAYSPSITFYERKGFEVAQEDLCGMYWPCVDRQ